MSDRIFLASPHMGGGEQKYIAEAFETNWIAPLGANVTAFEEALKKFSGANAVTALSAGTAALHLSMILSGVGPGDTVFCQDLTFSASVNPVLYQGARPVFLDSEPGSWNLDPALICRAIEKYGVPKALIAVHLYGDPCNMDEITAICREQGITLIEDAAEALGASYRGRMCGTFGRFGVFSFNGNKVITTSGGGALLSQSEDDAAHALKLATQSREPVPWYEHAEVGYNYRISNICAGIGRGQMEVLEERLAQKKAINEGYQERLAGLPIVFQPCLTGAVSNHWLTSILLERDCGVTPPEVIQALSEDNIEARHIWKPMHMQPLFADAPFVASADGCVSEDIFARGVCLPSDTKMTQADMDRVCDRIRGLFQK